MIPVYSPAEAAWQARSCGEVLIAIRLIHAALTGTQAAWFAELFKTNTRTSGASLGHQIAAFVAGFAPFLAVLLAASFGWQGPAGFYVVIGLVVLLGVASTRETWGPRWSRVRCAGAGVRYRQGGTTHAVPQRQRPATG